MNGVPSGVCLTYSCGHPGWAGRQDIDEGTAKLLIKSCPSSRGLLTTADDLVGQINWKTTQQGVSQSQSHHQSPNAATPIINSEERGGLAMTASMSEPTDMVEAKGEI